jgi:hypothetical protein
LTVNFLQNIKYLMRHAFRPKAVKTEAAGVVPVVRIFHATLARVVVSFEQRFAGFAGGTGILTPHQAFIRRK